MAACSALGAPELAPLCASIAGKIGGALADAFGQVFGDIFGGPDPFPWGHGFGVLVELNPVVLEVQHANFALLGLAASKLSDAFAAAGLPGTYDPLGVLRFLGLELVPTRVHDEPTATGGIVHGPVWSYMARDSSGAFVQTGAGIVNYRWRYPSTPPDWYYGPFADLETAERVQHLDWTEVKRRGEALIASMLAWRQQLIGATLIAVGQLGASAAAAEAQRQIEALRDVGVRNAQARALTDLAALLELARRIAERKATLEAYARGVTAGVTFLRIPKPLSPAEALRALARAGVTSAAQLGR